MDFSDHHFSLAPPATCSRPEACAVLANLAADLESQLLVGKSGAIQRILRGMERHLNEQLVQDYCIGALFNLSRAPENMLALALAGGEQVVKAALKIHPEAPTVRQVGQAQLAGGRCLVFWAQPGPSEFLYKAWSSTGPDGLEASMWLRGDTGVLQLSTTEEPPMIYEMPMLQDKKFYVSLPPPNFRFNPASFIQCYSAFKKNVVTKKISRARAMAKPLENVAFWLPGLGPPASSRPSPRRVSERKRSKEDTGASPVSRQSSLRSKDRPIPVTPEAPSTGPSKSSRLKLTCPVKLPSLGRSPGSQTAREHRDASKSRATSKESASPLRQSSLDPIRPERKSKTRTATGTLGFEASPAHSVSMLSTDSTDVSPQICFDAFRRRTWGGGGAAAAVGSAALHAGQRGAAIAQKGVVNLTIYVQRNPIAVSALCCLVGLALSVISVLSIIGVARMDDEKSWTPRDSCQMFYQFIFGFILILIDMKDSWANAMFGLQTKLFLYCNFLASQTGRACFYFYVGSISLFLLPSSEMWMVVYIILGGWLCLLGLIMLGLRFCECCCGNQPQPQNPTVGQATHVQS
eukprot:symbB.v1.2.012508.t1/scaffold866.1/size156716/3